MAKYAVKVEEILKRTVIVEADMVEDALDKVNAAIDRDELLLEVEDFDRRTVEPSEYWDGGKIPEGEDVSYFYHLEGKE